MKNFYFLFVLLTASSAFSLDFKKEAEAMKPKLIEWRSWLNKNPETGNKEVKTAAKIAEILKSMGLSVETGIAKTGVIGILESGQKGPTIALRAPIDAMETEKGVRHACGHDAMTTIVLGAAEILSRNKKDLKGKIIFIFQPAEEGGPAGEKTGAERMVEEGFLKKYSPETIFAFHVDTDLSAGQFGVHKGPVYAGSDTLGLKITGKSAHGATPHKGVDSIAVAAKAVSSLQTLISRETDIWNPAVLTVGEIHGGTRPNALAAEVKMTGTLRTFNVSNRERLKKRVQEQMESLAKADSAQAEVIWSEGTPPTVNEAKLAAWVTSELEDFAGSKNVTKLELPMPYADDFSHFSSRVSSVYFQLGTKNEKKGITNSTHTPDFNIDEDILPLGAAATARLAFNQVTQPQ